MNLMKYFTNGKKKENILSEIRIMIIEENSTLLDEIFSMRKEMITIRENITNDNIYVKNTLADLYKEMIWVKREINVSKPITDKGITEIRKDILNKIMKLEDEIHKTHKLSQNNDEEEVDELILEDEYRDGSTFMGKKIYKGKGRRIQVEGGRYIYVNAEFLRGYMRKHNLTQDQMGGKLPTHGSYIGKMIKYETHIGATTIRKVKNFFYDKTEEQLFKILPLTPNDNQHTRKY